MKPYSQYISLDCLFKKWKAFRFQVAKRHGWPRGAVWYYGLYDLKGVWKEADCTTFGAWVDLHTKQTGLYIVS